MEIQNNLRRVRQKLKLMDEPYIYFLLCDVIDACGNPKYDDNMEKVELIRELRKSYLIYINQQENNSINNQSEIKF